MRSNLTLLLCLSLIFYSCIDPSPHAIVKNILVEEFGDCHIYRGHSAFSETVHDENKIPPIVLERDSINTLHLFIQHLRNNKILNESERKTIYKLGLQNKVSPYFHDSVQWHPSTLEEDVAISSKCWLRISNLVFFKDYLMFHVDFCSVNAKERNIDSGSGVFFLYKQKKEKWIKITQYISWIS